MFHLESKSAICTNAVTGPTFRWISAASGWRALIAIALVSTWPQLAYAQGGAPAQAAKASHWGATGSLTPTWTANEQWRNLLLSEGNLPMEGSEFTVGLVRGSTGGGDWGVSFVRKRFNDGLVTDQSDSSCSVNACFSSKWAQALRGTELTGVEVHWFWAIATIKNRVQLGMNIAGGVAKVKGEVAETSEFRFTSPQGEHVDRSADLFPANEVFFKTQPLAKLEAVGAVIVAPGLKVKVEGGFNAPGPAVRVAAVYLIGAK
jgi:hypothetical protein